MTRIVLALGLLAAAVHAQWGRDMDPAMGRQLLRSVEDDLVRLVRAPAAERAALVAAVIEKHGLERIEALKRFRNPELKELFFALLEHDDWHVRHRALFVLESYGDPRVLEKAWALLTHPNRRLREKAAITLIKLWDGRAPPGDLDRLRVREEDFHVRRCLDALELRMRGKLPLHRVAKEAAQTQKNGLLLVPLVSGHAGGAPRARSGKGSAARLPPAPRWTTPLLGFGEEEVAGVSVQPFGNPRGQMVHVGQDVGACLDGAGYYAAAHGVVRLVHSGSDMGTLLVVEHHLGGGQLVNAVYMHGGDTVFVEAGATVAVGQLLGTMGLGFSPGNGGHYAHLHYGLYPGAFRPDHNYGYKRAADGTSDWFDPARVLPRWIARTRPLLPELRPVDPSLRHIVRNIRQSQFSAAHSAAVRVRNRADPGGEVHVDAVYLIGLVEMVPQNALFRARKLTEQGYPREAVAQLRETGVQCRGVPSAARLTGQIEKWQADKGFQKALKGQGRVESAARRAPNLKDAAQRRALWRKLLEDYGDTCLRPRIEERLR